MATAKSSTQEASSASASATHTPVPSHSHAGAIAGGVIGGVAGLLLLLGLIWFLLRRRRSKHQVKPAFEKSEQSDKSDLPTRHEYKSTGTAGMGATNGDMPWLAEKDGTSTPVGIVPEMDGRTATDNNVSELDSQASTAVK